MAPPVIQTLIQLPTATLTVTPTPIPPPIALLAGHSGGADTGAICPDGLREVDVTVDVAQRAKTLLEARGHRVDIFAEFDARLSATRRDYAPRAFLAIHADSCIYYASGYKVARAEFSANPEEDDRLTTPGECRYFATNGKRIAETADKTPPRCRIDVLVYPDPLVGSDDEGVHYALRAVSPDGTLWVNLVPAPGFPQINQIIDRPFGLFFSMQRTDQVR